MLSPDGARPRGPRLRRAGAAGRHRRRVDRRVHARAASARAFTRRIAQPLLGGIHAGDVDRLSLRALFPPLADADAAGGSVLAALARRRRRPDGDGAFRGLRGGMGQLLAALARGAARGGGSHARPGRPGSRRGHAVSASSTAGGLSVAARAVVLAVPAGSAARLVAPFDAGARRALRRAARACRARRSRSATRAIASRIRCRGIGFVVPRGEATRLLAVSWVTSKWAGRAPRDGSCCARFAGGALRRRCARRQPTIAWWRRRTPTSPRCSASTGCRSSPACTAGPTPARSTRSATWPASRAIGQRRQRTPGLFLTGSALSRRRHARRDRRRPRHRRSRRASGSTDRRSADADSIGSRDEVTCAIVYADPCPVDYPPHRLS